ncbi:hypothetical protein GUJ93_ZPchr0002g24638 [Zizania palustris]|uniref:Uncharacterized protein n=1 Tax=Zizania palustris TaxID=103762 RepID=A0A8J5SH88_ZIZPA|nr:hypothetical protein GUJ93_ZPchr0002g24638 [Zizania palustris]
MDRRQLRSAPREEERLHRFLRPGALARLRDSRIVARSLRSAAAAASRLLPTSLPPSPPPTVAEHQGGAPHFLVPARGLGGAARYPLRRRLSAARSAVYVPSSPDTEAFFGAFAPPPPDLVPARAAP